MNSKNLRRVENDKPFDKCMRFLNTLPDITNTIQTEDSTKVMKRGHSNSVKRNGDNMTNNIKNLTEDNLLLWSSDAQNNIFF